MIKPFLIALQFLTQLPVRFRTPPSEQQMGQSLAFYPLVGLLIGSLLVTLGWLLNQAPPLITSALIVTGWVLLTGALHLDGLADTADAWVGGMGNREKTLAIMKDPNCGPMGVVALVLVILLKFVALYSLTIADEWVALLLAIILTRTAIPLLFLTTPYVRGNQGLGASLAAYQPRQLCSFMVITTLLLTPVLAGILYLWLIIAAGVAFVLLRKLMLQRLGGMTGDTMGALIELIETILLLVAVVIVTLR